MNTNQNNRENTLSGIEEITDGAGTSISNGEINCINLTSTNQITGNLLYANQIDAQTIYSFDANITNNISCVNINVDANVVASDVLALTANLQTSITTPLITSSSGEVRMRADTFIQQASQTLDNRGILLFSNNQDGATFSNYQGGIGSWNGIGFKSLFDNITRIIFQLRTGTIFATTVNSQNINLAGASLTNTLTTFATKAGQNVFTGLTNTFNTIVADTIILNGASLITILSNYGLLFANNNWTGVNTFDGIETTGNINLYDAGVLQMVINSSLKAIQQINHIYFGASGNNRISFNNSGYLDYLTTAGHAFYINSVSLFSITASAITLRKKTDLIDDTVLTATQGNLTLTHTTSGESSVCFPSAINFGSDYGYIKYVDNYDNVAGEKGRLIIGVENDGGGATIQDAIILYSCNGTGSVGINTFLPTESLDVVGNIKATGSLAVNAVFIAGVNILSSLSTYGRLIQNNFWTGTLNTFTNDLAVLGSITKVLTIFFGTNNNYIGINQNNNFFSYFAQGGHAFYAANQAVATIDVNGLSMITGKTITADVINCNTINTVGVLQNRLYFKIQNIGGVITISYESVAGVILVYPGTSNKITKLSVGSYSIVLNPNIITNNNFFVSFSGSFNNQTSVGSAGLSVQINNKGDLFSGGSLYGRIFYISVTKNNTSVLTDIANNTGFIDGLVVF